MLIAGYDVTVEKKNIKHLHIYIKAPDGSVYASVPRYMTEESIRLTIESKREWIHKHKEKMGNREPQCAKRFESGETLCVWGVPYRLALLPSKKENKVTLSEETLFLQVKEESSAAQREKIINEWYRELLKKEIPGLLQKWEPVMGVHAEDWQIKNMRTRWGTCNVREKRIWINLNLAKKNPVYLEYIVVHELCHLIEKSHNEVFKKWMTYYLPDWRNIRKALNER